MSLFGNLFGRRPPAQAQRPDLPPFAAAIGPNAPLCVIGDIHGCDTLLTKLLAQIEADHGADSPTIITVGDYVDRGENSRAVLADLYARQTAGEITCLMGNHEEMLLNFLDDPERHGPRWLRYGGLQTVASYGLGGVTQTTKGAALIRLRDEFAETLGPITGWLRDLPLTEQSGNVAIVHAGADPAQPIAVQSSNTLLWGHPDFDHVPRQDETWVVHGHTIINNVEARGGRIDVDTGAYATGRLSASILFPNGTFRVIEVTH